MKSESNEQKPVFSLRERKKAKTRAAIQRHALRLFQKQGYAETTVEQIADAAEVSPSTFFRYFPSKEDVVLWDSYDPIMVEALRDQPAELSPIRALREAIRSVWQQMSPEDLAEQFQRSALVMSVPELRAHSLDQFIGTIQLLGDALAERTGRELDDPAVRNMTGAVMGVALSAMLTMADHPDADIMELMDDGLAFLEAGLPL